MVQFILGQIVLYNIVNTQNSCLWYLWRYTPLPEHLVINVDTRMYAYSWIANMHSVVHCDMIIKTYGSINNIHWAITLKQWKNAPLPFILCNKNKICDFLYIKQYNWKITINLLEYQCFFDFKVKIKTDKVIIHEILNVIQQAIRFSAQMLKVHWDNRPLFHMVIMA